MTNTLKIKDTKALFVYEAFGMERKTFDRLTKAMSEFFTEEDNADNIKSTTKTELLELFLTSDEFENCGFVPETPNDFFLLGFMFSGIVKVGSIPDFVKDMITDQLKEHIAHGDFDKPKKEKKKITN